MHSFHIYSQSKEDNMALFFCLRACRCPCVGFNFNPLSTSATRLLPTAIYYRQIGRFQGVSRFVLAPNAQPGDSHSFFPVSLHGQSFASHTPPPPPSPPPRPLHPPSGSVRAVVIVTKSSGKAGREGEREGAKKEELLLFQSKEGGWQWSH